mgnify:CR=1 FL=1
MEFSEVWAVGYFLFQAEDGIRDLIVTGVQTCALPIYDDLPLVPENALMDKAILTLSEKNLGAVLVINDKGDLLGMVTDGDLKRHMAPDLMEKPVRDVMSANPKSIEAKALAVEAVKVMTQTPGKYISSLIVMDNGKLAGMIRLQDCIQAGLL